MLRLFAPALLALLVAGCGPANSQPAAPSDEMEARVIANLKHEFPQIAGMDVSVDSLRAGDGVYEGTFLIPGQPPTPFLITGDGETLYLLASDPIDVSRDDEALATAATEADSAAAAADRQRAADLAAATAGLPVRGNPDAPVTIVEFSDFECPYCRLAAGTVKNVLEQYPDDVKLVYAHFPLGNHPWATPAAIAASCAAEQDNDAFWTLHDLYFDQQGALTTGNVVARSRAALAGAGIDLAQWDTCAADESSSEYQTTAAAVDAQMALGEENGVRGTPAFFVNGRFINGNQPLTAFVEAIEAAKQD